MSNTINVNTNHLNLPALIFLQNVSDNPDYMTTSHKYTDYDKNLHVTADSISDQTRYTITHPMGFFIPMLQKSTLPTELISVILLAMTKHADTIIISDDAPYYPGELNTYGENN